MSKSLLVAALLGSAVPAQVVRLSPVADTTADHVLRSTNFGAATETRLGSQFSSAPWLIALRGFFRFDLTSVQQMGPPVRATFRWYQWGVQQSGPPKVVTAHRVTAPWAENTLTWENMPANDALVIDTNAVGAHTAFGWKEWDLTPLVQDWLRGVVPNHGFVLRHPTENEFTVNAGVGPSRENPFEQLRPYLELDYGATFGRGCATVGSAPVLAFDGGAPSIGSSFTLRARGLLVGSRPSLFLGLSNSRWIGRTLPFNLAGIGFPACDLLVSLDAMIAIPPLAGTGFDVTLPVPNDTGLVGHAIFAQAAAIGPAGSLHMSNGFGLTLY